jgi:DNA-binding NarL/FixJ family response regulator
MSSAIAGVGACCVRVGQHGGYHRAGARRGLWLSLCRARALDSFRPREQQALVRLATGAPNKEIGRDLGLAEITIKLHVRRILKKIGARIRSEAASIATRDELM